MYNFKTHDASAFHETSVPEEAKHLRDRFEFIFIAIYYFKYCYFFEIIPETYTSFRTNPNGSMTEILKTQKHEYHIVMDIYLQ